MNQSPLPASTHPRRSRKAVFVSATVLLCALILEGGARLIETVQEQGRAPNLYGDNPYVTHKNRVKVFDVEEQDGRDVYRRSQYLAEWIYNDLVFPVEKPGRAFRVFCLGGSASMGWPYKNPHSYPGLLEAKLRMVLPGHDIEVINLSGFSFASYRVKAVFDEVIEYDPDLILVYSGNNEFLENFVYSARRPSDELSRPWRNLAMVRLVYNASATEGPPPVEVDIKNYTEADFISNRLSFAFGKASRLRQSADQLQQAIDHYHYNIGSLTAKCRQREVPVMLLNVPVNSKDWKPNVSIHRPDLSESEELRWQESFREGVLALEAGDADEAADALERAREIDEEYAEGRFLLAKAYHLQGKIPMARAEYTAALAHDAYPFRALPEFQEILARVAADHDVPLVDIVKVVDDLAEDGIPGLDVMLDYVHPTAHSNDAIATAVLAAMEQEGLLPDAPAIPISEAHTPIPRDVDDQWWTIARLHAQFLIMRQYEGLGELVNRLARAVNLEVRKDPAGARDARSMLSRVRETQRVIEPYQRLLRAEKLGILDQEFTPEQARKVFADYIQMIRRFEARQLSDQEFEEYVPELEVGGQEVTGTDTLTTRKVDGHTVTVEWDGNVQIMRFDNGKEYSRGTFLEGKREGVHRFWTKSGSLKIESNWVAGRPEGRWLYFYEDGSREAEGDYRHGVRVGPWETWHRNGNVASRGTYAKGKRDGEWEFFDESGNPDLTRSGRYQDDRRVSE